MSASVKEWSHVLTPRERAVALLVAGGLSNKVIAFELGLSVGTVKIHVHRIFQKLGIKSRNSLIIRHGTRGRAAVPI
jgi:two-component system, NarL family, nitrate/nitrite response regulator NarL